MKFFTNKKPVLFLTLVLLPLLFVYLLSVIPLSSVKVPKIRQGILDLSDWDFEQDGVVPLDGEWEFYWNQLLTYQDFLSDTNLRKSYVTVPSMWNYYTIDGFNPPGYGYGTYRLKIKTAAADPQKAIKMTTIFTAYKIMVNNAVVAENGIVGTDAQSYSPEFKPQIAVFKTDAAEFEVIVQVANFTYARGGLCYSIYFGTAPQIAAWHEKKRQIDVFLLGAISITILYHAAFYLMRRRYNNLAELYFILIMLIFAGIIAFEDECIILSIFPTLRFDWIIFFEYATRYWGAAAFALFMHELYPAECSRRVRNLLVAIAAFCTLVSLVTSVGFYTNFAVLLELLLGAVALYYTYVAWLAVTRKRTGAALLFGTIVFAIGAFIFDTTYLWNIHNKKHIAVFPLISFILIFVQSFILSQRFSASFAKIEALSKKLLSLDKIKDAFLANTSHELRTPLHGMISVTQSVLEDAADTLPQKCQENLSLVVSSGQRLANLINDILDYEKLKQGDISLHKEAIDIRQVIPATLEVSKYLVFSKPITLTSNLHSDLPLIEADENRLIQIIYNLLGNAIKFTEQGTITISAVQNKTMVEISVTDTGIGIPPDKIPDIFKSFEQLETISGGQYSGTGLGLSITKYLVEIHGGSIWATSELGQGSTLTFSMPVSHAQPKAGQPLPILSGKTGTQPPRPRLETPVFFPQDGEFTILFVDDDFANLQFLLNIAAAEHYSALAVASGKEALAVLAQNKTIDLVILDIMLPVMSGYEVCRKLREDYSLFELPVLMMTAQHSADSMLTGFAAGANDFLSKPLNPSELKARMKTLLQLKKSVSQAIQAEMAFLQAQIKPHFLYNALNTIMSFCWTDAEKAGQLLLALSDYLRGSFNFGNVNQFSTLEKELEFVDSYLAIEKSRFEEKLSCQYHITVLPGSVRIPTLVIQPLVENAIKHGILPKKGGGNVVISATRQHSAVVITIQDDGVGIPQDKLDSLLAGPTGKSVGLTNINRRLKRLYGHGLEIVSKINSGTIVSITIPDERREP